MGATRLVTNELPPARRDGRTLPGKGAGVAGRTLTPMTQSEPRPRTAQRVALVAGSLVGVSSFFGPDAADHFGLLVFTVVAAFVGWLDWRAGASRRQIMFSILLAVAAVVVSRVTTFVILFLWAFG